ncbi:MAG: hypothetical protein V4549_07625 [Bacteroidota bacterium]
MEKKIIKKNIGGKLEIDMDYPRRNIPISELTDFLELAKKDGATHIEVTGSAWSGSVDSVTLWRIREELESDEDLQKRVDKENQHKQLDKERRLREDLDLYNKLKQKFEK